ncbi:MAG: hypothetical protein JXA82_17025 [Sedimentisphaerales bacterium]|nr:hypothetical protein [Sedimentisphaerales bacterium]
MKQWIFISVGLLFWGSLYCVEAGDTVAVGADDCLTYILSCQKSNGAFGPSNQHYTDVAWTYPAVAALRSLGADVPRAQECLSHGRNSTSRMPYWTYYQQTMLSQLLSPLRKKTESQADKINSIFLRYAPSGSNYSIVPFYRDDTQCLFTDLNTLWYVVASLRQEGMSIQNHQSMQRFVQDRQDKDASFGEHIIPTCHAVLILRALDRSVSDRDRCISWIQRCQVPEGGFRYHPASGALSNQADIWYTWSAVRALRILNAKPRHVNACVQWINSLQNADGGFGDRPGWQSRLYSTYYAVDALRLLTGNAQHAIVEKQLAKSPPIVLGENETIHQFCHVQSLPDSASLKRLRQWGLDLVALQTNPDRISIQRAENLSFQAHQSLQMEIAPAVMLDCRRLLPPQGHDVAQMAQMVLCGKNISEVQSLFTQACDWLGQAIAWSQFQKQVLGPFQKTDAMFRCEHDYGMINAYILYDDGLDGRAGVHAVLAANMGEDYIRHYPYRERWLGKLPFVTETVLPDSGITESERFDRNRVLFFGRDNTFSAFLEAARKGKTTCVLREDTIPGGVVYYGSAQMVQSLCLSRSTWQWWSRRALTTAQLH